VGYVMIYTIQTSPCKRKRFILPQRNTRKKKKEKS